MKVVGRMVELLNKIKELEYEIRSQKNINEKLKNEILKKDKIIKKLELDNVNEEIIKENYILKKENDNLEKDVKKYKWEVTLKETEIWNLNQTLKALEICCKNKKNML